MAVKKGESDILVKDDNFYYEYHMRNLNDSVLEKVPYRRIVRVYDDIVDKTDYIPDSEMIRQQKTNGASATKGLYDFNSGKEFKEKKVSNLEVLLRTPNQNTLDKADIPVLMEQIEQEAKTDAEKAQAEKLRQEQEKVNNLREKRLNEMLGVVDASSE